MPDTMTKRDATVYAVHCSFCGKELGMFLKDEDETNKVYGILVACDEDRCIDDWHRTFEAEFS